MQTITLKVAIPENRRISVVLPDSVSPGPAEIVVIVQPQNASQEKSILSIDDLGWSREKAAGVRSKLASFIEDWDDPRMDIYNEP